MTAYASNTGTRRNLEQFRRHGWRVLLTPDNPTPREGLRYGIDNGAWKAFKNKTAFDEKAFTKLAEVHGSQADFVVLPDIVAGGMESLRFSISFYWALHHLKLLLLPIQDGMDIQGVVKSLESRRNVGLFLGGTTEYKLATMHQWGTVAATMHRYYHVGRVNTQRRIRLAAEAGADSFDGTSGTMYSCNVPRLDFATRQPSFFAPNRNSATLPEASA